MCLKLLSIMLELKFYNYHNNMFDIQKYIWKPKIFVETIDDLTSRFEVKYLPRWFGHTFWSSLRRAIVWYSMWWAVTWVKVKWVSHEYHVIDGVKEAVIDIILNFKKLRFKVDENVERIQWISQRFKWVGVHKSNSLQVPSWIEILNEDIYLFEITDPWVELLIDFRVEKWYWYYNINFLTRRDEKEDNSDIWLFQIDNDFKAIEYIKYEVEEVIDDFTWGTKDCLLLEIKTISSRISPKEILAFAWEVINSYSKLFIFDDVYVDRSVLTDFSEIEEWVEQENTYEIKTLPIDALPLSERTKNALIKNEIKYVEDLEKKRKNELLSMKGVGRKAVDEIVDALKNIDKTLEW